MPESRRPAVLLVDDARVVLRMVERSLADAGFALRVAEGAEEALKLLEGEQFTCAVVDRNLVDADGLDIIKEIRARQPRCACILMTAYPSLDSAVEALRAGVVDYIQKPSADFNRIVDRVQKAIRLHGARGGEGSPGADPRGGDALSRAADAIADAVRALQAWIKPRGRAVWNRALAEAEAHAAAVRKRR
jgi:DNA-binding NtrC family response regulator